jgi:hypothetical protein
MEIEFAVDLDRDETENASFYLLQIKPLLGAGAGYNIDSEAIDEKELILLSRKSMGNGLVDEISDVIFLEPEKFDNKLTLKMAEEIAHMNELMTKQGLKYILIGPGRWGTRDKFLGIPVTWPQISNAKVIVEVSLPDFHPDASLGSHFFHNVTSMNVGYFSVVRDSDDKVFWEKIKQQRVVTRGGFFRHVRFERPLVIRMDGRKGMAVISMNQ